MLADIYFGPEELIRQDRTIGGGGIGTLTNLLCPLLAEMGLQTTVYQSSDASNEFAHGDLRVVNIPLKPSSKYSNEHVVNQFRKIAAQRAKKADRIELFVADFFSVRNDNPLAIAVQNGLAWDAAIENLTPNRLYHNALGEKIFRYRCQLRGLRRFETCYNRVAVDLYFLNWYRSFRGIGPKGRVWYNPNPAPASDWDASRDALGGDDHVKIIFARRLVPEKGSRLIIDVFKELLSLRPNISITIAGNGSDKEHFQNVFGKDARVNMIAYQVHEALQVHQQHDISVTPSLCGEATCLAILEAMAAGCAVIATNMGGTITEIIDGYNGKLCWPNRDSILQSLIDLVDDQGQRRRMQKLGWETSQRAFNPVSWNQRWKDIITTVIQGKERALHEIHKGMY